MEASPAKILLPLCIELDSNSLSNLWPSSYETNAAHCDAEQALAGVFMKPFRDNWQNNVKEMILATWDAI